MRKIERTGQFKRDYKRESKGRHGATLDDIFIPIVGLLAKDMPLEPKYRDHALSGDWNNCRDCHIKPDLVLIYQKPDKTHLILMRLASHAELGF